MRLSASFFYAKYGNIKFAYYAVRLIAHDTPKKFAKINRVCYDVYINQKIDKTGKEMRYNDKYIRSPVLGPRRRERQ